MHHGLSSSSHPCLKFTSSSPHGDLIMILSCSLHDIIIMDCHHCLCHITWPLDASWVIIIISSLSQIHIILTSWWSHHDLILLSSWYHYHGLPPFPVSSWVIIIISSLSQIHIILTSWWSHHDLIVISSWYHYHGLPSLPVSYNMTFGCIMGYHHHLILVSNSHHPHLMVISSWSYPDLFMISLSWIAIISCVIMGYHHHHQHHHHNHHHQQHQHHHQHLNITSHHPIMHGHPGSIMMQVFRLRVRGIGSKCVAMGKKEKERQEGTERVLGQHSAHFNLYIVGGLLVWSG